jgi:hypothetical protein
MLEHYIDSHSCECLKENERYELLIDSVKEYSFNGYDICNKNPKRFLFFIKNKFVLITYHSCIHPGQSHIEFKQELIKKIIVNNKIYNKFEIGRVHLDVVLKQYRLRNKNLKKYHDEINYIYSDNAGKQYAICNEIPFIDSICNQDEILENYKIAKEYLIKNGLEYLLEDLDELYYSNHHFEFDKVEIFKTIDHLITNLQKQI